MRDLNANQKLTIRSLDGKNAVFLSEHCDLKRWIATFHTVDAINSSRTPGYPVASPEKSLATWAGMLSGTSEFSDQWWPCTHSRFLVRLPANCNGTRTEIDERIFALRPYVFACAKVCGFEFSPTRTSF